MGMYKYLSQLWQNGRDQTKTIMKERLIKWRKEPSIVRLDGPTRLDKARRMGYKAKQGFVVSRVKIGTGQRTRRAIRAGRKPKRYGRTFSTVRNLQAIAEQRASRKFPNMEVLNSYFVIEDSKHKWYEVILIDKNHPAILSDKDLCWMISARGRAERGLTSAGRRSRGSRRNKSKSPSKRSKTEKSKAAKRRG